MTAENTGPEKMAPDTIAFTVRLPREIEAELPDIAAYLHKLSKSDLVRDWIVKSASEIMARANYQRAKKLMHSKERA
jgi:hypothetical protein